MQVNIHHAKTHLSKLLERVETGEEILIARNGKPIAKIVPISAKPDYSWLGQNRGKIRIADDFDAPLPDEIVDEFYK